MLSFFLLSTLLFPFTLNHILDDYHVTIHSRILKEVNSESLLSTILQKLIAFLRSLVTQKTIDINFKFRRKVERERYSQERMKLSKSPTSEFKFYFWLRFLVLVIWFVFIFVATFMIGPIKLLPQIVCHVHIDDCFITTVCMSSIQIEGNIMGSNDYSTFEVVKLPWLLLLKADYCQMLSSAQVSVLSLFCFILVSFIEISHHYFPQRLSLRIMVECVSLQSSFFDTDFEKIELLWSICRSPMNECHSIGMVKDSHKMESPISKVVTHLYSDPKVELNVFEMEGMVKSVCVPSALYFLVLLMRTTETTSIGDVKGNVAYSISSICNLFSPTMYSLSIRGIGVNVLDLCYIEAHRLQVVSFKKINLLHSSIAIKLIMIELINHPLYKNPWAVYIPCYALRNCEAVIKNINDMGEVESAAVNHHCISINGSILEIKNNLAAINDGIMYLLT